MTSYENYFRALQESENNSNLREQLENKAEEKLQESISKVTEQLGPVKEIGDLIMAHYLGGVAIRAASKLFKSSEDDAEATPEEIEMTDVSSGAGEAGASVATETGTNVATEAGASVATGTEAGATTGAEAGTEAGAEAGLSTGLSTTNEWFQGLVEARYQRALAEQGEQEADEDVFMDSGDTVGDLAPSAITVGDLASTATTTADTVGDLASTAASTATDTVASTATDAVATATDAVAGTADAVAGIGDAVAGAVSGAISGISAGLSAIPGGIILGGLLIGVTELVDGLEGKRKVHTVNIPVLNPSSTLGIGD